MTEKAQPAEGQRRALLLLNFGTPQRASPVAVGRFLQQMLTDPRVLDLAAPLRLLLGGLLIPLFRSGRSTAAYRSIWTPAGSPIRVQTEKLLAAVQSQLGEQAKVWYAMRLGRPSIAEVLRQVQQWRPDQLTLLPLYPQYASSTTGTAVQKALERIARWETIPEIRTLGQYAELPQTAAAFAAPVRDNPELSARLDEAERVLFSFHGLPISHLKSSCRTGYRPDCPCALPQPPQDETDRYCYRAACYRTARALADHLNLPPERWLVGFQSRLGSGWQQPFTDRLVEQLARDGVRRLFVFCPSFAIDCLETLEEIGLQLAEQFRALGGEWLQLAPCPNANPLWVKLVADLASGTLCPDFPAGDTDAPKS